MQSLLQDLKYSIRILLKNRGVTIVAMLTLALSIGANTAVFSLVHKILLTNLPVKEPEQLVVISRSNLEENNITNFSHPFFRELEKEKDIFEGVLSRGGSERVTLATDEGGEPAIGELVSGSYFEVLGIKPHAGRLLAPSDDVTSGAHPVVVLSYRYWQRRFGSNPSVVGTTLRLSGYPMTVVGVSPQGFDGLDPGQAIDMRVPMAMQAELRRAPSSLNQHKARELNIVGRLKSGVSIEQAQQVVSNRLKSYLNDNDPATEQNKRVRESERVELLSAANGFGKTRQQFQITLWVLMALTMLVLLIACLNLANLLLAKTVTREQEFAVRLALGARPVRIVRQLLTESVLLSLCGAVLGLILAFQGSELLMKLVSGNESNIRLETKPDLMVLMFHLGISVVCGILFGLAPALSARNYSLTKGLNSSAKGKRFTGRKLLVSAQVALSVIVLVVAGLFIKTVQAMRATNLGFRSHNLLALSLSPKNAGRDDSEVLPFFRKVRERVSELPGVGGATFSQVRLLSGSTWRGGVAVEGFNPTGNTPQPSRNVVGPDYFRTMGIPLIVGRDFTANDNATAPKVAVINESFAKFYFGNNDPIGKKIGTVRPEYTIVGVARDGKYGHVREATERFWYISYEQQPNVKYLDLYVRTTGDPESMTNTIRSAIVSVDKSVALFNVRSQSAQIEELFLVERMLATLATVFAATAAALAALGLYGVLAFMVTERRRDIGIRMAIGAQPLDIFKMVLGQGMKQTLIGILLGLAIAFGVTRLLTGLLYGVSATDAATFVGVSVLLIIVASLACFLPARRATKVDPIVALKYE